MSEWIRSLGGLDAPSRAVELWMADDEVTADAVVDEAARDVANATTQAAMVDLLRDRSRNVAKILGIDKEVDGRDATPFQSIYCTKHELPLETYRFSPDVVCVWNRKRKDERRADKGLFDREDKDDCQAGIAQRGHHQHKKAS